MIACGKISNSDMHKIFKNKIIVIVLSLLLFLSLHGCTPGYTKGKVVDSLTGKPIKGAYVTVNNTVIQTDEKGIFIIKTFAEKILVRAHGYMRTEQIITHPLISLHPFIAPSSNPPLEIKLVPFKPRAVYLSFYGAGDKTLRGDVLKLIEETELNAVVIDIKGDRGMISYKSSVSLASEIGAQRIKTIKDINGLVKSLKEKDIYTIARIVVFKDNLLALAKPDLSVKTPDGAIWFDKETLAWVDPFKKEVWDYNISIAIEAAQCGFDEIQFDYVRFPDAVGLKFSMPNTEENRVKAISGFLLEAKKRLVPYNVFLAADIFGYVFWNNNDTDIGQRYEDLVPHIDYLSPMLYPSGFRHGIPGYRNPVAYPYEIVYLSLRKAQERTHIPSCRFRPWLQAFRDYAFDGRIFGSKEIRDQINASEKFGTHGWMLWNPRNIYSKDWLSNTDDNLLTTKIF
ncbi:MAG: putative glycoside hydrolase [Nitrospirota bacterium]